MDRDWLARRIETEAWAYANADHLIRDHDPDDPPKVRHVCP